MIAELLCFYPFPSSPFPLLPLVSFVSDEQFFERLSDGLDRD